MLIGKHSHFEVVQHSMDNKRFIIGFDILPSQSPHSNTESKFAAVVLSNGTVVNEFQSITRRNLLVLVREIRPIYLATDNIFEIVPDSKTLSVFVDKLPIETKIVQVTGVPPKQVPLKTLARAHGISVRGKPDPLQSALISARLAEMGVGYAMECCSEQTEIKVSRGRKMGRGGQSANRYRRKLHSEIQQLVRFIEFQLKDLQIDYDIDVRESDFGYSSARIVAYAPLPIMRRIVETRHDGDINVEILPVRKATEFVPIEQHVVTFQKKQEYFILGVDPGTTAAICLITLDGRVQLLESHKRLTRADIIRRVYEYGIPVVIATDTFPVPHLVRKIASILDVQIITPNRPIPVSEKQNLAREFIESIRVSNAHERDALSAAVYAYRSMASKLEQIDQKVREENISVDRNQLKALVIKGMSVSDAIAALLQTGTPSETEETTEAESTKDRSLETESYESLKAKYEELKTKYTNLSDKVVDLEKMIEYLKFRESELARSLEIVSRNNYWRVKRDREVVKKQTEVTAATREIRRLNDEVKRLRTSLDCLRGVKRREICGDMIAVKVISQFSREAIEDYVKRVGLKQNDIVLFENASGGGPQTADILIERNVRAIIVNTPMSHLAEDELVQASIPVIKAEDVELERVDEFAFISRKKFEEQFRIFFRNMREIARRQSEDRLIEIVERYRHNLDR